MRVGVAGIGKMDAAIAARLDELGETVAVLNRSPARAVATGLAIAERPRELASASDIVISSLFDETAVEKVYGGQEGLLEAAAGKIFVEMSTVRPGAQRALARAGGIFVECPVGGTTGPARSGRLLGLAGGEAADLKRARPLLDKLCYRAEHMGPAGSGALAKLAINLPLRVFWQSLGEALSLAKALDKDLTWLVQLFSESAGGANVLELKAPAVAAALAGDQTLPATFDVEAMCKDLRVMAAEGMARGLSLPVALRTLSVLEAARAWGLGDRDCAYVPAFWVATGSARPSRGGPRRARDPGRARVRHGQSRLGVRPWRVGQLIPAVSGHMNWAPLPGRSPRFNLNWLLVLGPVGQPTPRFPRRRRDLFPVRPSRVPRSTRGERTARPRNPRPRAMAWPWSVIVNSILEGPSCARSVVTAPTSVRAPTKTVVD